QDWHDEPRLQHPPAGSARADGSCTRLSALTGGVRVASCKGPRGCRLGVKTVPDRGLTSAQALQPLAQLRQKSPKASIVRGSLMIKDVNSPMNTLNTGSNVGSNQPKSPGAFSNPSRGRTQSRHSRHTPFVRLSDEDQPAEVTIVGP